MQMPLTATQPKTQARLNVWPAVVVFLIALAVRLAAGAVLPLLRDESWHLLAGHSWIYEGTLRVDQGAYTRAGYFTVLVAWFMNVFGETLAVARFPGIIAGAALVAAVFEWLRRRSGMVAAWTGAMLLCFHDLSILLSAEVRFYSLHALCLWLTAAIVYQVTEGDRAQRLPPWTLAIAAALSVVALHVQVTAGVGLVALVAWAICDLAYRSRARLRHLLRGHPILAAMIGIIVLAGVIGVILYPPAPLVSLYADFRHADDWAQAGADWGFFYHRHYSETITLFWGLFPLAFIAALIHRPRAAIFCAFLLVVPMVIMSFGAQKAARYVFFALPYLFAIWGLAAEAVFPTAVRVGYKAWGRAWNLIVMSWPGSMATGEQRLRRYSFIAVAILVLALAVISQASYRDAAKLVAKSTVTVLSRPAQLLAGPALEPYESHRSELMSMIKRASVFITAEPTTTMLELGPFDVILSRVFPEMTLDEGEFAIDLRLGRPTITTAESLQAIMNCYQTGIVIVPIEYWRNNGTVIENVLKMLGVSNLLMATSHMTRFTVAGSSKDDLLVYEWQGQMHVTSPQCDEVRSKVARTS